MWIGKRNVVSSGVLLCSLIAAATPAGAHNPADSVPGSSVAPISTTLFGQTPSVVTGGTAIVLSRHDVAAPLQIAINLPLRNQAALRDFLTNQASHGVYLTQDAFNAQFGPTQDQVQAVLQWAGAHQLTPIYTSPNRQVILLQSTTGAVAAALSVQINEYRQQNGQVFYSNDRDPIVPASLGIAGITGLNSLARFHTLLHVARKGTAARAMTSPSTGYTPSEFRSLYDLAGHGYDGTNQVIDFTLWGGAVPNSDLTNFHNHTSDTLLSAGSGADQVTWNLLGSGSHTSDALDETAMDVQNAHGIATHAHLNYFLGDELGCPRTDAQCAFHTPTATCTGTQVCIPSDSGIEAAVAAAASDPSTHVVSNSWGGGEATLGTNTFANSIEQSLVTGQATGITFFFSSGDTGSLGYPADSPNVVSVGGTNLQSDSSFTHWQGETVWNNAYGATGGGCSSVFSRPGYQVGVAGAATCAGRAEPDVAADGDPATGAVDCYSGQCHVVAGTSLAAPLWAGMAAVANRYAAVNSLPALGWLNPKIYALANNPSAYANDFHDVTGGTGGGTAWDQVTGWGSIDWWNWVRDIVGVNGGGGPTNTPTVTLSPTQTGTPTNTPVPGANAISNGDFENGTLAGWNTSMSGNAEVLPVVTTSQRHGGSYSALVGGATSPEPNGDSCLYQNFTANGGTFSAYYLPFSSDSITYDWQQAYLLQNPGATTCARSGTQLFRVASNSQNWTPVTASLNSGLYQVAFDVHEDGYGDLTYMYVDDVTAPGSGGAGPTFTPTNTSTATGTPTSTPTVTQTGTPANTQASTSTGTPTNTPTSTQTGTTTNTPALTSTPSQTSTPTSTSTSTPTPTNTTTGGFSNPVVNGGFETGDLTGWTAAGVAGGGMATVGHSIVHSGGDAALIGVSGAFGTSEPVGDNCLYQNEQFSGTHSLSFSYAPYDQGGDTISYDWQEAYWRAAGTSGCGESGTQIFKVESNSQSWNAVNMSVTGPGQIYFNAHEDGYIDPSAIYIDDVSIH